jgi:hypothetical protein
MKRPTYLKFLMGCVVFIISPIFLVFIDINVLLYWIYTVPIGLGVFVIGTLYYALTSSKEQIKESAAKNKMTIYIIVAALLVVLFAFLSN